MGRCQSMYIHQILIVVDREAYHEYFDHSYEVPGTFSNMAFDSRAIIAAYSCCYSLRGRHGDCV